MELRILHVNRKNREKVNRVVNHAKMKKNWYDPSVPGWMNNTPGHDRKHQCKLNDFRCVFSYTVDAQNKKVVRHLSISVPRENYPSPWSVKAIAELFGFTGKPEPGADFPKDWALHVKKDDPVDDDCIVIGQDTGIRPYRAGAFFLASCCRLLTWKLTGSGSASLPATTLMALPPRKSQKLLRDLTGPTAKRMLEGSSPLGKELFDQSFCTAGINPRQSLGWSMPVAPKRSCLSVLLQIDRCSGLALSTLITTTRLSSSPSTLSTP